MAALAPLPMETVERFGISGMTCAACAGRVRAASAAVPGVHSAKVDVAKAVVLLRRMVRDPRLSPFDVLRAAVNEAGYGLERAAPPGGGKLEIAWRPLVYGFVAASSLLGFYLGLITLVQGWDHAAQQLAEDLWFVGAIMAGFGTQIGLFTYLRGRRRQAPASGVAASTGTSTAAMLACCAHHVSDVLPIIGLSGAAIFLDQYKTPLLWLGIAMNMAGIGYLLWQISRQHRMASHLNTAAKSVA